MKKEEIKVFVKRALKLQNQLEEIEETVEKVLEKEIKSRSSFGDYAVIEKIYFEPDYLRVKVYDAGYDLYESEVLILAYNQLAELMP